MPVSLQSLPPELYTAILVNLSATSLQQTALSLTRALPLSPIPQYHLFTHIHLKHPDQVVQLYRRLRGSIDDASWVTELALETWTVDADVVINLVNILPRITYLTLFIGPNFAPEHLQEIFETPKPTLQFISLRFRPYVQRATYYQFLKGAYFDSILHVLSQWPQSNDRALPSLSIVQDPIDPEVAQRQHFAQPLVFFRLDPLTTLVRSNFLRSLTSLRLRIPGRQFVRFICADPGSLPALELLDISTCLMLESEVETLLMRFTKLRHLILDGCSMKRLDVVDGEWVALGKNCSLAGVKRAKEREKKLRAWLDVNAAHSTVVNNNQSVAEVFDLNGQRGTRRPRRGRRGLATATISLRESSARDNTLSPSVPVVANIPTARIRILPTAPSLTSLAITISSQIAPDRYASVRTDFGRGWTEGLAQLTATRNRLRQSWQNGVRLVQFSEEPCATEEGLDGLVDAGSEPDFNTIDDKIPLLCLAGPGRKEGHIEGCGHAIGWDIWKDDL